RPEAFARISLGTRLVRNELAIERGSVCRGTARFEQAATVARHTPRARCAADGTFLEGSRAACPGRAGPHEPLLLQVLRLHLAGRTAAEMGSEPHQSNDLSTRCTLRHRELQRGLSGNRIPASMAFEQSVFCSSRTRRNQLDVPCASNSHGCP